MRAHQTGECERSKNVFSSTPQQQEPQQVVYSSPYQKKDWTRRREERGDDGYFDGRPRKRGLLAVVCARGAERLVVGLDKSSQR